MAAPLRITPLSANTVQGRNLLAEHGMAVWIEAGPRAMLFDTGQGLVLEHNAKQLGVDLSRCGIVALSHGHYDHTGGLPALRRLAPHSEVFAHPNAMKTRFSRQPDGRVLSAGCPQMTIPPERFHAVDAMTEITPGVWLTGPVPRRNEFETAGGNFFFDEAATQPDEISDDQAMVLQTVDGIVLLAGCAHSGIVNILDFVAERFAGAPLLAILGGLHLSKADDDRLARTVDRLEKVGPGKLLLGHCTGERAMTEARRRFGAACEELAVGKSWEFPPMSD
jgi:7,8-dihydropterin-6-yl-methyl-4-(beta-D-ribofuranosyl)aminobenzene 5'-phosphate synthase